MYILYILLLLLVIFFSVIWIFYKGINFRDDCSIRGSLIWRFFSKIAKRLAKLINYQEGIYVKKQLRRNA